MNKYEKILLKILQGASDANISFDDLCALLEHVGFEQRIRAIILKYHLQEEV